jgi:hypothetical protein
MGRNQRDMLVCQGFSLSTGPVRNYLFPGHSINEQPTLFPVLPVAFLEISQMFPLTSSPSLAKIESLSSDGYRLAITFDISRGFG